MTDRISCISQGIWGTVCDDYFGDNEAKVVCRMLGFLEKDVKGAFAIKGEREFSASSGPIWVRIKQTSDNSIPDSILAKGCRGTEESLTDCNVRSRLLCKF